MQPQHLIHAGGGLISPNQLQMVLNHVPPQYKEGVGTNCICAHSCLWANGELPLSQAFIAPALSGIGFMINHLFAKV